MSTSVIAPNILLVEPQFVLRRTVVAVARELGVAQLHEAASSAVALRWLTATPCDGLVLDIEDDDAPYDLLRRLRAGEFAADAGIPVLAMLPAAEAPAAQARLAPFHVFGLLHKPFKVAELLQWLGRMRLDDGGQVGPVRSASLTSGAAAACCITSTRCRGAECGAR